MRMRRKNFLVLIFLTLCLTTVALFFLRKPNSLTPAIIARSQLSLGDPARLYRVMDKARRGEPITIGFIGGSITKGQAASSEENSYANRVVQWWKEHFPKSNITTVNAGVDGTDSSYGVLRLQHDLLSKHPDFVVVEFGVNDHDDLAHAETYEGIVRQLLTDADQPAVLLLFLMHHDGTSAQDFQAEIGKQYRLPMASYRDALWPEIAAGRLKWSDITDGAIHPNDRGHAAAAAFVNSILQKTLDQLPTTNLPEIRADLAPPRYTDLFDHTQVIDADLLKPVVNIGWSYDPRDRGWVSSTPGSSIEFDATGKVIDLMYARVAPYSGTAEVSVDDCAPAICDAWFDGTWEGFCRVDQVARNPEGGTHRVRIKLLSTRNPLSTGYEFRIMGLGLAK
jgi:lysophospholipase L1-like esterase